MKHDHNKITTIYSPVNGYRPSAVSIIRISGPETKTILFSLCEKKIIPHKVNITKINDHNDQIIDKGIVLFFPKPQSLTGEDLAEIHVHGSPAILRSLEKNLSFFEGVRKATPGEFTKRAFYNNKMDLVQVEGLGDLIYAETESQLNQAQNALMGGVSESINRLREELIGLIAKIEALIDFSDEDLPAELANEIKGSIKKMHKIILNKLENSERAIKIREGLSVAIMGPPNAGKSSLMNEIVQQDVSIIDKKAGTTRDVITATTNINGLQVTFYDTAGLQESRDRIEKKGIDKSIKVGLGCDIQIKMVDGSKTNWTKELDCIPNFGSDRIELINKMDLKPINKNHKRNTINVSVTKKTGINKLFKLLQKKLEKITETKEPPIITRYRHYEAIKNVNLCLERASSLDIMRYPELLAEEIRMSVFHFDKILGKIGVEDVLDSLFEQFCIGK